MKNIVFWFLFLAFLSATSQSYAFDYHVGPDQEFTKIGDVPWESLNAGDAVYIHWRTNPYHEKWVIGRRGTEQDPILVSGVAGPNGELPVISGENATTRGALDYTNEVRGLIKIGSSNVPEDVLPSHIIIENLELRSARPPFTFEDYHGGTAEYITNAASIYVEKAEHLIIRNCAIHDSGNGIFIGAFAGETKHILIEKNRIFDNGIVGSIYEHNTYTAAIDIVYQYNYFGALRAGALGNNLKDRSAGLVVRHNWIENGNRQLDLVDAEDSTVLVNDPSYKKTHVYGNVLLEEDGQGNSQMVHYGGDSGTEKDYRKGTLFFYNNTLISTRSNNTTMLRLSTNEEFADVHNNIVYVTAPGSLALVGSSGQLEIRNNWLPTGYRLTHDSFDGVLTDDSSSIIGSDPGFADTASRDFHLLDDSAARNGGVALYPELLADYPLSRQYVAHTDSEERHDDGALDVGAFEYWQVEAGDIDGRGGVDLNDALASLQVAAGLYPETLYTEADVDGDQNIGMQEALHALITVKNLNFNPVPLVNSVTEVQPMTGIVLWDDSPENESSTIQLEYRYVGYDTLISGTGSYNWTPLDTLLDQISARGHQGIVRMYFVYPGAETTVPQYIKNLPQYSETQGISEGQDTWFPDWTSSELQEFVLEFFDAFAARYDNDPRLAFLQVGFGLWGEYHIYNGPMSLGGTFPSKDFQATFLNHLESRFENLVWSISIDAAETDYSPFGASNLLENSFGLFDDSFLHAEHHLYNRDCFSFFSWPARSALAPMGGELNYYTDQDQRDALNPAGPHGISFEQLASEYNISYMIGNDQPRYQTMARIKEAGMAIGYKFRITALESNGIETRGTIENIGIAPIYYDAFVSVNGVRSSTSLKGLIQGETLGFLVSEGGVALVVTIACDKLVAGQVIQYEASLSQ